MTYAERRDNGESKCLLTSLQYQFHSESAVASFDLVANVEVSLQVSGRESSAQIDAQQIMHFDPATHQLTQAG